MRFIQSYASVESLRALYIYLVWYFLVSFELHSLQYMVPTKLHDVAMGLIHSIRLLAFIHSTNPQLWTWIYLCMLCL